MSPTHRGGSSIARTTSTMTHSVVPVAPSTPSVDEPSPSRAAVRPERTTQKYVKLVAIGGIAGASAKTFVAPLERLRIMAQTGASKNAFDTLASIYATEGVRGYWRGNFINCARIFPARGILFSSNDFYVNLAEKTAGVSRKRPELLFACGSLAGITATVTTYPLDVVRTRIAGRSVVGSNYSGGIVQAVERIRSTEGLAGFYRGAGPTVLGALPYEGIKFSVFGMLKSREPSWVKESGAAASVAYKLGTGAVAGTCAGLFMFPNDTVRRLLQMQGSDASFPQRYSSALDCWKQIYTEYGVARFYRGIGPYLLRMVPNSAIQFGTFEAIKQHLDMDE